MKKFRRFRMLPVLLSILICLVFLVGCGAGASEKDSVGGAHVTLHSTKRALLPVFTGQLAIVKQGDLWVLEGGKEPLRLTSDGCNCCPAWSPDGKWLLFYKYDPAEKWNRDYSLWVARADGMGVDKTRHIVGFIETAKFNEYKDGELIFTARGGSDTGNF